jgi:hypothetical protein
MAERPDAEDEESTARSVATGTCDDEPTDRAPLPIGTSEDTTTNRMRRLPLTVEDEPTDEGRLVPTNIGDDTPDEATVERRPGEMPTSLDVPITVEEPSPADMMEKLLVDAGDGFRKLPQRSPVADTSLFAPSLLSGSAPVIMSPAPRANRVPMLWLVAIILFGFCLFVVGVLMSFGLL